MAPGNKKIRKKQKEQACHGKSEESLFFILIYQVVDDSLQCKRNGGASGLLLFGVAAFAIRSSGKVIQGYTIVIRKAHEQVQGNGLIAAFIAAVHSLGNSEILGNLALGQVCILTHITDPTEIHRIIHPFNALIQEYYAKK